ncbi:hypothetical protein COL447_07090 [Helicobacter pylori]
MFLGLEGFKRLIFNFLNFCIPSQYSLVQENNINGKFDEKFVLTHKGNLVGAISLCGITYSNFDKEEFVNAIVKTNTDILDSSFEELKTTARICHH